MKGFALAATVFVAMAATIVGSAPVQASPRTAFARDVTRYTVVVNTDPAATPAVAQRIRALGVAVVHTWPQIGVLIAETRNPKLIPTLRRLPQVTSAGRSGLAETLTSQQLPARTRSGVAQKANWNYTALNLKDAHTLATGAGVAVGVADTGVDDLHEDLAGAVDTSKATSCADRGRPRTAPTAGRPFLKSTVASHGTMVASIIAARNNSVGSIGVAPAARIVPIQVVLPSGNIYPEQSICAAMVAGQQRLPVLNHSYFIDADRFFTPRNVDHQAVITAVRRAFAWSTRQGVIHVAGTGNDGIDLTKKHLVNPTLLSLKKAPPNGSLQLPTELSDLVLGASQMAENRHRTPTSTYGLGRVHLTAPGDGRYAEPGNQYGDASGTSFAAPQVSGVLALMKQKYPQAGAASLRALLLRTATPISCAGQAIASDLGVCQTSGAQTSFFGHGLVNPVRALRTQP